ncbi:MAG: hypothetical protein OHK0029_01000 [Armatimonadaceae bacterium]
MARSRFNNFSTSEGSSRTPPLSLELLSALDLHAVASATTIKRGVEYFRQGRVIVVSCEESRAFLKIRGTQLQPYTVHAEAIPGNFVTFDCDCPAFHPSSPCKHIVASVYALRDYLQRNPPLSWKTLLQTALDRTPATATSSRSAGKSLLLFSLQERGTTWEVHPYGLALSKLPPEAQEPPWSAEPIAQAVSAYNLSDQAAMVRTIDADRFANMSDETVVAGRLTVLHNATSFYGMRSVTIGNILPHLSDALVFIGNQYNPLRTPVQVHRESASPVVYLSDTEKGILLEPRLLIGEEEKVLDRRECGFLSQDPFFLRSGTDVYPLKTAPALYTSLISRGFLLVPEEDRGEFYEKFLLPIAEQLPLRGDGVQVIEEAPSEPERRLYLHEDRTGNGTGSLRAQLRFAYQREDQEEEFVYTTEVTPATWRYDTENRVLRKFPRKPEMEQAAYDDLKDGYGLKRDVETGWFVLRARTEPLEFLLRYIPQLTAAGYTIYGEETLASLRVNRVTPSLKLNVSSGLDWFDLDAIAQFGETHATLKELRRAIRHRERYVKLADGSVGMIPPEWLNKYRFLFGLGEEKEQKLRLGRHQALLLEEIFSETDLGDAIDWKQRLTPLLHIEQIPEKPLPTGLRANLYPYQKTGYDWLHFLHDGDWGGCLADDMGLGKTLESIAFLLSLRGAGGNSHADAPDLVVVPRSLLFNWEREVKKFAPDLRILLWDGVDRARDLSEFQNYDLVLTTYRIMLNEIEELRKVRFHYAVLDEAQAIKNPLSQTARAARLLNADHRLTLTGTPIENASHELWSQFEFVCPGMLGSLERFRSEFAQPIEKDQDAQALETLRRMTQPFLLRRTKELVAPELPPRTEEVQVVDMEPAQRRLYNRYRDQYRANLLGLFEDEPLDGEAQIKVLEALLRLRQICCHPRLVEGDFRGDSAKFLTALETIETLIAEGHKALIFSQFTQVLALVRQELEQRKIPYVYLDGRTRDRQSRVDQFQSDSKIPLFLISLKAGGFGLNLTAADYVLHLDTWWNPAAEQQATDRAHRIGQDKPVFVYKYVARDSVEEKILELQERKKSLADQLITSEKGVLRSLTRADLDALFS